MADRHILLATLVTLAGVGAATLWFVLSPAAPAPPHVMWWIFLILLPLLLATAVVTGLNWAALLSVAYGTIGLALDVATLVSIVGGRDGSSLRVTLSFISAAANFVLIVYGGRASWTVFQERRPPGSRPPSPPSPSSSSRV